jgi:hypothetical protein
MGIPILISRMSNPPSSPMEYAVFLRGREKNREGPGESLRKLALRGVF